MSYYMTSSGILPEDECLEHYGILRQKWGVRRFQNTYIEQSFLENIYKGESKWDTF